MPDKLGTWVKQATDPLHKAVKTVKARETAARRATSQNIHDRTTQVVSAAERSGSTAVAKRPIRFVGGILVVAVPAYFTFVPPDPTATVWPTRALIMAGWLLVLVSGVFIASAHDISIDRLATRAREARTTFRRSAVAIILKRLLPPPDDAAKEYTWALYVPDKGDPDLLIPLPEISSPRATRWRVGTGVTGIAYARKEFLIGQDDDLKPGGRFAPQPGQSSHLQDYRTVVAQPILNASGQALGVLTAATTTDQRELLNDEGRRLLADLSLAISRVLVDILSFEE